MLNCYNEYIHQHLSNQNDNCSCDSLMQFVVNQPDIEKAIKIAVNSRDETGKMNYHQSRVPREAYGKFGKALVNIKDKIEKSTDFDQLFTVIQTEGKKIHGVGELFIYDTAFRIGQKLKIYPDRIYLHRGTRIGVERFMGRKIHNGYILKEQLKPPFDTCPLECWQLEDFFCIYKDIFLDGGVFWKNKQSRCN